VRVRSTRPPRAAVLRLINGRPAIELLTPEEGVSPGQACVIYSHDGTDARVLGGGTIAAEQPQLAATDRRTDYAIAR
jgi:tRNA-uridine 2-sulfurtransferase